MATDPNEIPEPSEEIVGYIQRDDGTLILVTAYQVMATRADEEVDDDSEPIE